MKLFDVHIPMTVLIPLVALALVMTAYFFEAVAYYAFYGWYYRTGPVIRREQWQTNGSLEQVRDAVRPWLDADGLVGRESLDGFKIRQQANSLNSWPRIILRVEETGHGASLCYEVRPFYGIALLFLPITGLAVGGFGLSTLTLFVVACTGAIVIVIYKLTLPWDIARISRLPSIRRALAPYGLLVCEGCGYDLFGLTKGDRCPECGRECPAPYPAQVAPRSGRAKN